MGSQRARALRTGVIVLAAGFVLLLTDLARPLRIYDEGIVLFGARRVLEGDLPYRDFWTLYAPGQFYVLAAVFKVLGASVLAERLWDACARAALAWSVYALARRLGSPRSALIAWLAALLWLGNLGFHGHPAVPAAALGLSSALVLAGGPIASPSARRLVFAGLLAGAATLFRHDLGILTLLAEGGVLLVLPAAAAPRGSRDGTGAAALRAGLLLAGALAAVAPAALALVAAVPAHDLVQDLIVFPAATFPKVRALPFPGPVPALDQLAAGTMPLAIFLRGCLRQISFYLFPAVIGTAAFAACRSALRRRPSEVTDRAALLTAALGVAWLVSAWVRPDLIHLLPASVPAFPLAAWLAGRAARAWSGALPARALTAAFAVAGALWAVGVLADRSRLIRFALASRPAGPTVEAARPARLDPDQAAAARFLRDKVGSGDSIYVGLERHDLIYLNDVSLYFLAGRRSATRYHELHPGAATAAAVQEEIVRELEREAPPCVVLVAIGHPGEPNESNVSSGVTLLDDHIGRRYVLEARIGRYSIFRTREPRPGDPEREGATP